MREPRTLVDLFSMSFQEQVKGIEMDSTYLRALKRLRGLREAAGLTLKQLEIKSRGSWKAVVVGSSGNRSLRFLRRRYLRIRLLKLQFR